MSLHLYKLLLEQLIFFSLYYNLYIPNISERQRYTISSSLKEKKKTHRIMFLNTIS